MRDDSLGQRSALKTKLLIGVAGLAAVFTTAAAAADATDSSASSAAATPPADPPKWSPYADVGGGVGDAMVQGRLDVFVPVQQDLNSLIFLNAGIGTETHYNTFASFGVGYRTKFDPDWILGIYAGYDSTHSEFDHNFNQFAFSAEAMSVDWDARVNAYLADDRAAPIKDKFGLFITGTNIAIVQGREAAYSGFDGEVGYRIFGDDSTDVRVYAGGYDFTRSGYQDISGPKGRIEATIYDLDELGMQSRLTVQGGVSHDDVRGTDGFVGAALRIPLGAISGGAGQTLDELDRRMVDPVRRQDNVLTQWRFNKPEPVIIYGSHFQSQPTNTLLYVDNSTGAGTLADPTTFGDAAKRGATDNAFIVGTSYEGHIKTGGAKVASGETIVGGGETFTVKGTVSGATFTHDFAPGSKTPTFTSGSPSKNVFNLSGNNAIYGLNIATPFNDAIYGHNAANVTIGNVSIDGSPSSGAPYGINGIVLVQDVSQDSNISIEHTKIANVLGYGINILTNVTDGGSSTHNIDISNVHMSDVGVEGIDIASYVEGSALNQTVNITNGHIHGVSGYGIAISGIANGGSVTQNITVDPTVVSFDVGGLFIGAGAYGGGHVSQTANVSDFTANHTLGNGVEILGIALHGDVYQSVTLNNVKANHNLLNGVDIYGYAGGRGTVEQHLTAIGLTAEHNGFTYCNIYGCYIFGGGGLNVTGTAAGSGKHDAVLAQYVTALYANLNDNAYAGLSAIEYAFGDAAAARQDVFALHSSMSGNGYAGYGAGVFAGGLAEYGGSTQQYVVLGGDAITGNLGNGATFIAEGLYEGFAEQSVILYGSSAGLQEITGNLGDGVYVGARAYSGGQAEQNFNMYFTDASHNGGNGVTVATTADSGVIGTYTNYYSHVTQNVIAAYDNFSNNGGDGIRIDNLAQFGGATNQLISVYFSSFAHNGKNGFHEKSVINAYYGTTTYTLPTQLYSDVYFVYNDASHNKRNGIAIDSYAYGPAYVIDHALVYGSTAKHNHRSGFESVTYATGYYGFNLQYLTLAKSSFDHNHGSGASFYDVQNYGLGSFGAALQEITIGSSDFSHNRLAGLYALAYAFNEQGRAEQNFTIGYSAFDSNGIDGIALYRRATGGTYVSGYDCSQVQGLTGGCAFVRQTVTIGYSDASGNGRDGIRVNTYADKYGAVYTVAGRTVEPTLILQDVTAEYNGEDGLNVQTRAGFGSYVFELAYVNGSHFDHNGQNGITEYNLAGFGSAINYVNGTGPNKAPMLFVKNSTANYNGGSGLEETNHAGYGSAIYSYNVAVNSHFDHNTYAGASFYGAAIVDSLIIQAAVLYSYGSGYTSASHNGIIGAGFATKTDQTSLGAGIDIVQGKGNAAGQFVGNGDIGIGAYAYGYVRNYVQIYGNNIAGSDTGIYLENKYALQVAGIGHNTIAHNTVGVYAKNVLGLQAIGLYYKHNNPSKPLHNTFSGNGTDFVHTNIGGLQKYY